MVLAARENMGNPPVNQCLVFEDAINGIRAAKSAGMHVGLPSSKINLKKFHNIYYFFSLIR